MDKFNSPYVRASEHRKANNWCRHDTRLDTYGRGCLHNCDYCYARHMLDFRGNWSPYYPAVADIGQIREIVSTLPRNEVVRLGGMTDCYQPIERIEQVTLNTIKALNDYGIHYLIVTKSAACVFPEYLDAYDPAISHFQISITSTDDWRGNRYETASPMSLRIWAVEELERHGFDACVRLSPYIPEFVDVHAINNINCAKILIEFLKVNPFTRRVFDLDYTHYTVKYGGQMHLPIQEQDAYIERITGFDELSVGASTYDEYMHFRDKNANPYDCCNLRGVTFDKYPEVKQEEQPSLFSFDCA